MDPWSLKPELQENTIIDPILIPDPFSKLLLPHFNLAPPTCRRCVRERMNIKMFLIIMFTCLLFLLHLWPIIHYGANSFTSLCVLQVDQVCSIPTYIYIYSETFTKIHFLTKEIFYGVFGTNTIPLLESNTSKARKTILSLILLIRFTVY